MSWLGGLLGEGVSAPIKAVGDIVSSLYTKDGEMLDKETALLRVMQIPGIEQMKVNQVEASHRTVFVAGWRPAIGWVCAIALLYTFVARDLLAWGILIYQTGDVMAPPELAIDNLITVLLGMLGLGSLRTLEKIKGVSK